MVMQLRSCCCGCTLKTGTIIIAVLGLLSGISFIVDGIFQSDESGSPKNSTITPSLITPTLIPEFNITGNGTADGIVPGEHGFRVSQTIYGFLELIICALLLVGAMRNSAKLIYPWIIVSMILCVGGFIIFMGIGIVVCLAGVAVLGFTYIIYGLISTAFQVYFILVVNSFHTTLKSGPVSRA